MAIDKIYGDLKLRIGDKVVEVKGLTPTDITNLNAAIAAVNGLVDVASSGAAADVTIADAAGKFTATNVEDALAELANLVGTGTAGKTVYLADVSSGQTAYAKVYKLYQGADASDMSNNTEVGTINIPKDMVVQSGSVVTIASNQDSDGDTTSGLADGTYIKLVLQNVADPLYINATSLVDVYTGSNGSEIVVGINSGVVSASLVDGSIAKAKLASAVQTTLTNADSDHTALANLGITNVAIVNTFTADESMVDGHMEFAAQTSHVNAVTA